MFLAIFLTLIRPIDFILHILIELNVLQHSAMFPGHKGSFKNHKNAFLNDLKSQKWGLWAFSYVWSIGSTWLNNPKGQKWVFCIMLGFEAVLPSLPYLSLSLSCFLYRRSTKGLLFFSWFDKNGFNSMCFYQCAFKVEKFMISGRNNSCSRMGLERKLCRLIPWDFRSPINSY